MMPQHFDNLRPNHNPLARWLKEGVGAAILLVDDDEDFLCLVREQVAKIPGSRVMTSTSCDEAVACLQNGQYHLVICDWALASRTGPEVFQLADPLLFDVADGSRWRIPVMFMSGSEKVASTQGLRSFRFFEPVSFILKNLGPVMIGIMAENILQRFNYRIPEERPHVYHS